MRTADVACQNHDLILLTHIPCPAWPWPRPSVPHEVALGDHDCSAIDVIGLPGNVVGINRGQKGSHSSNIFRLIPTSRGEGSKTMLDLFFYRDLVSLSACVQRHHRHVSDSGAGTDSIDINMMGSKSHSSTLCHGNHPGLTDPVMQEIRL